MPSIARLATYIRHAPLVAEVVRLQAEISRGPGGEALKLLDCAATGTAPGTARRRAIGDCVNFGLRLGGAFGLLNSCFTRSIILCALLRREGVDARVAFGLNAGQGLLDGHCWVVEGLADESAPGDPGGRKWQDVKVFPAR